MFALRSLWSDARTSLTRSPLRLRFARGVFWSISGSLISQALSMLSLMIAARMLGQEQFGELGIINSTVGLFGIFAGMGLGLTTNRHVALYKDHDPDRAGQIIGMTFTVALITGSILSLVMYLLSPWIAPQVLNAPDLVRELQIGCLLLFVNALQATQTGALAGFEEFSTLARINAVQGAIVLPVTVAMIWLWQLPGAIGAYIVTATVLLIATQLALRAACRRSGITVDYGLHRSDWRIIWEFSFPALITSISSQPVQWFVRIWLVNQPQGYAQMAIFTAAYSWSQAIMFVPSRVSSFLTSFLSNLYGARAETTYRRAFYVNLLLALGSSTIIALAITLLSQFIMSGYGEEFTDGANVLIVVSVSSIFAAGTLAMRNAFYSQGRMWNQVGFAVFWSIVLLSTLIFLPKSALGLATAYLVAFASLFFVQLTVILKKQLQSGTETTATGFSREP
jgi:O-antigen/teichoic acid export membrane protein